MRTGSICVWLMLFSVASYAQPREATSETDPNREKAGQLYRRIYRDRDYAAFSEIGKLPASISIPLLWQAYEAGPDPVAKQRALEVLKNLHGFKEDFQKTIAAITNSGKDPGRQFQMLTTIGSLEAAEVIAPYLFDFRGISYDKALVSVYNFNAALALAHMRFRDAPTSNRPEKYGPADHIAWQKWAIAHGMVPKEWDSRVGVPEWQHKMAAAYRAREQSELKPSSGGQWPADPKDARRVWPPAPKDSHASQPGPGEPEPFGTLAGTAEPNALFNHPYLWGALGTLLAGLAGWLAFRVKRKSREVPKRT